MTFDPSVAADTRIMDGKKIAKHFRDHISAKVKQYTSQGLRAPGLGVVLVGEDPASAVYVKNKRLACEEAGLVSAVQHFPADISTETLINHIHALNLDENIDGILVQLPLPAHINQSEILETILPEKDVDGFHAFNIGKLVQQQPTLRPCTPKGVVMMLEYLKINVAGKNAVIVGASNIVGRPMGLELLNLGATITICHRLTQKLPDIVKTADILVVAIGNPHFIQGDWIKPNAIVIDVGINRLDNGKLTGDVCFNEALERAQFITPVPGGVGPMTIVSLLDNTLQAYEKAVIK